MQRLLFICSANRLRSPTAEQVFSQYPNVEARSAGLNNDAVDPLSPEHFEDIDLVFVMEKAHRSKLSQTYRAYLKSARVICLNIPDDFEYMQPELITLLKARVTPHLR
ncbi:low molecular weight protein tyrosine phosphatase family protein [Asticcacaulis sp. 201]|uniref:low molecular weight protein tyrosine phosphatase family protein n=1 Tax=Asticcacaulis sp. 201 TaxID=3028787 RepID=UPI002915F693|nr:low molecular weight protein tyrosine phosphatase family protein [Asticcacaulis sp. 201]MDV6329976.1 low molecular weight protein tyrosine phosphatase family protein [Asticcacaulis sp. 201]